MVVSKPFECGIISLGLKTFYFFDTDLIPMNPRSFYFRKSPKIIGFRKVKESWICNQLNFMTQCIRNEQQL